MTSPSGVRSTAAPAGAGDLVLHVRVVRGSGGGPEGTIFRSAAHLGAAGYRPAAAYMHPPRDPGFALLERRAGALGCPLVGIPDAGPFDPRVLAHLLRLCGGWNVRVWHGHDYKSNLIGLILRPLHRMALATTVHGWVTHTARTRLYYAIDRLCLRHYDHVASVSPDLHRRVQDLGVPSERCSLIPNGVDENAFRRIVPARQGALRARLNVPSGRTVIGAVGRLSDEKGFEDLIDATARLLADGLDAEVWIAGEGPARGSLEKRAAQLGVSDRIRMLGFVDDPAELYQSLDVFTLPSLREGLPNAMLEAMAASVPVVATRVAGVPSAIEDGVSGLLCPPAEPAALAAALAHVIADPGLRERLAASARATIEERFTFTRRMRLEVQMYERLLADPRARR